MRKSLLIKIKLLGVIAALMLCTTVSAVGMGGINVTSALGQQLKADIELVAVSKAEKSSLVARLASPEAYKSAGLDFPFGNKFKFQVETRADGEPYLVVTSAQPLNDPFVIMLVELTWSSGKLLREYTFLLDPPGYVPQQPAQAAVQPVAPAVQSGQAGASAVTVEPTPTPSQAAEVPAVPPVAAASEVPIAQPTVSAADVPPASPDSIAIPATPDATIATPDGIATGNITLPAKEWLVVQRGDTLREIAAQYKLAGISLERMLVALYRINAGEFDGNNMNRIKAGKILQLPHEADVVNVTETGAKKEIRAQAADWNVYRQKLASAAAIRESQAAQQVATGKISSSIADQTPVAKESAKEVLKLSRGEAPGDQAVPGAGGKTNQTAPNQSAPNQTAQDKANAAQEESIAKSRAAKEEQMRTAMLEKNIQDMRRLAELKAEAAALAQAPGETASKVVVTSPLAASAVATASSVAAASAVAPVAKPKEVAEPSLLDEVTALLDPVLSHPLYLAGGAALLLVLGGLVFLLKRRKNKTHEAAENNSGGAAEDRGSASGRMTAPVVPSPDTGDFTRTMVAKPEAVAQVDNVDPISEADLFLNFGRDAQAEEILKEALKNTPNNHLIHLKLLGIYANRKDANQFESIAHELQKLGNEHAWEEAAALGRELDPGNPLYGGTGGMSAPAASLQTATFNAAPEQFVVEKPAENSSAKPASSGLDFDFDLGALSGKTTPAPEQDFLADSAKTMRITPGEMAAMQPTSKMDPAGSASANESAPAPDLSDLIFSVTGSHAAMPATQPASPPAKADDGAMEFTMDFPVVRPNSAPASQAAEAGLSGINLNLADPAAPGGSTPEIRDDHWQEVATKLDLAKAYQEMGDADGVREILAEVLNEGDAGQQETARTMLRQLG